MNYIFSRKKHNIQFVQQEPKHFRCGICDTTFQQSDLEFDLHHGKSLGKNRYRPDVTECPFCGSDFDMEWSHEIELPRFEKPKGKEVYGQLYQVRLEARLKNADFKLNSQMENEGKSRAYIIKCLADAIQRGEQMITNFPRTKKQDCMSHSQAIKAQIDWVWFDDWVFRHGLPCPVP